MAGRVESVVFNGITFRRYPDSIHRSDRLYFTPGAADKQRGFDRLHREVWKSIHGPIPPGCDIHHRDHDPGNNSPDNLVCIADADHKKYHARQEISDAQRAARYVNQLATADWHASNEGRVWHSENGRRMWANREARTLVCAQCGQEFETRDRNPSTRFCSANCRSADRRDRGADNEDRVCAGCGGTFRANRYSATKNCSRKCAWAVRRRSG